jgi:hypothetical protein
MAARAQQALVDAGRAAMEAQLRPAMAAGGTLPLPRLPLCNLYHFDQPGGVGPGVLKVSLIAGLLGAGPNLLPVSSDPRFVTVAADRRSMVVAVHLTAAKAVILRSKLVKMRALQARTPSMGQITWLNASKSKTPFSDPESDEFADYMRTLMLAVKNAALVLGQVPNVTDAFPLLSALARKTTKSMPKYKRLEKIALAIT